MSNGERILTIPRGKPVNAFTMGGIIRDAGLTVEGVSEAAVDFQIGRLSIRGLFRRPRTELPRTLAEIWYSKLIQSRANYALGATSH